MVESETLGFGIRNTAKGIRNPTNDWNPGIQVPLKKNPEFSTWNPKSRASKTVLDSLTLGDMLKEITLLAVSTSSIYLHAEVCGALKVAYPAVLCAAK